MYLINNSRSYWWYCCTLQKPCIQDVLRPSKAFYFILFCFSEGTESLLLKTVGDLKTNPALIVFISSVTYFVLAFHPSFHLLLLLFSQQLVSQRPQSRGHFLFQPGGMAAVVPCSHGNLMAR